MKIFEGSYSCSNFKFAIVLSKYNDFIGQKLLDGAIDCLKQYECPGENIDIVKVPGAYEIPLAAERLAEKKIYNAIICLGAVIRGATPHFDYVAGAASTGISEVSLRYKIPISFGVLTTNNVEQAIERSGTKAGNKGWEAALTAIEMADLMSKI